MPTELDEVIKTLSRVGDAQQRLEVVQRRIDQEEKRLAELVKVAEQQANTILKESSEKARQIVKEAEARLERLTKFEQEVVAKEKAVGWVDERTRQLTGRESELAQLEKTAQIAKQEHLAAKDYWTSRSHDLDQTAEVLTQREQLLTELERRIEAKLPTDVVQEKLKETKKSKK